MSENPSQIPIKDQLSKLIALQKFDGQIYAMNQEMKEKPEALEVLKQDFEKKKAESNKLEEDLKAIQLNRKELELELKAKEDNIAKAKTQLSQIKTNKEYTAKIKEIEGMKADQSDIEEKILISFDEAEELSKKKEEAKKVLDAEEKKYLSEKAAVEASLEELKKNISDLQKQREGCKDGIDASILNKYEKILAHKNGLAIAAVEGTTCGGCYMNITNQMINALKLSEELVECEICSRILYLKEDFE